MARDPLLELLFEGPSPTARRIDGMRDARHGKPRMSRDRDYRAGYDAGLTYGAPRAVRAGDSGKRP